MQTGQTLGGFTVIIPNKNYEKVINFFFFLRITSYKVINCFDSISNSL